MTFSNNLDFIMPAGLEARPYQARIVSKTIDHLTGGPGAAYEVPSVIIESPTGSGKTVMGMAIAAEMQRRSDMSVGWCAMRRNLLHQAQETNALGFGVRDLKLISMFDKDAPPVDLLIIDEAQHDGAMSMATLHDKIRPKKIIGLSATPYRSDRVKLCFAKSVKDAGIHNLIQDGYLARYHHYTIPVFEPRAVAETYARETQRWGQSLFFFPTMAHCRAAAQRLGELGVPFELVTGSTDRQSQIERFAAGVIPVLISMQVLAEGFDCPSLKTVFVRPSGKLCTIQMGGRALRKYPDHEFKQMVQCTQTKYPFPRAALPAEQFQWIGDSWRSLIASQQINKITVRMLKLIADGEDMQMPKHIVVDRKKERHRRVSSRPISGDNALTPVAAIAA